MTSRAEQTRPRGELLLELLSEEIPARMQPRAVEDLVGLLRAKLAAAEIPAAALRGYVTARRLAVVAEGIPARQPDRAEERRGPRVGAPNTALDGFLRAAGLAAIEECEVRQTDRGAFYFAVVRRPGQASAAVLPDLIEAAIAELPWPKSMRYPASKLRWVRPLRSVVCLFDGAVLPLALDQVPVGRITRGHRWLSNGQIEVAGAADYVARLADEHVVLDRDERRRRIETGLAAAAAAAQVAVAADPDLVDEVAGLVEFPVVLAGAIDAGFMNLPPEVLRASMRTHQRYFSCLRPDGSPAARFLFVADNLAPDGGERIVAGNERVLRARLADARFFWDQDRKAPLSSRVETLKGRVYHEKLGSVYDKVERIERIAQDLAHRLAADAGRARRAARLAKADLSTGMVGEFPELQGVMGRYYALHDGEDRCVADAIREHYRPLGPNDASPSAKDSVVVALADKIDSLVAFFAIDEKPTGSRDPFALRRAALGVIRLILENRLRLPLCPVLQAAGAEWPNRDVVSEVLAFIADRLRIHLRDEGLRHDLVAAVFARLGEGVEDDLVRLIECAKALEAFLASDDGNNLLTAYRRASNIVAIETRKGGWVDGDIDLKLRREREEFELTEHLARASARVEAAMRRDDFAQAMAALATLRRPVDAFFDKVTVNTEDRALRENRLRLLSRIHAVMNRVADFSRIEG